MYSKGPSRIFSHTTVQKHKFFGVQPSLSPTFTPMQRRQWHPTPVLLPGKSHGQRSLVGCSPCSIKESDMTEQLHFLFHFHALEKETATHFSVLPWRIPGTGAWWATVCGVTQSWTRLKRLSTRSSSSSHPCGLLEKP